MARALRFIAVGIVALAAFPAYASAGALTLHPAGFGEKSYAAWKAHQGLPDTKGNDDQSLYFQKMTTTGTFAAGVAVIKGIAGTPLNELNGLAWDHREDGHCGAGAPRWNVSVRNGEGDTFTSIILGCYAAQHVEDGSASGHGWCRDTYPSPAAQIASSVGEDANDLTITGLAIFFDEGTDTANPPPAGCAQENLAPGGFVHLDNITVTIDGITHCWTGANDNGSGGASTCPASPAASAQGVLGTGLSLPTALAVDPTDTDLVTALNLASPSVPLASWSLYPNVVY